MPTELTTKQAEAEVKKLAEVVTRPKRASRLEFIKEAFKNQKANPESRQIVLGIFAWIWGLAWSIWLVVEAGAGVGRLDAILLCSLIGALIVAGVVSWLLWSWKLSSLALLTLLVIAFGVLSIYQGDITINAAALIFGVLWIIASVLMGWFNAGAILKPGLPQVGFAFSSGILWTLLTWFTATTTNNWMATYLVGMVSILVVSIISLYLPLWLVEIGQAQVYIDQRQPVKWLAWLLPPEAAHEREEVDFLRNRRHIKISTPLRDELLEARIPEDLLQRFLAYDGPAYMIAELTTERPLVTDRLINQLRQEIASATKPRNSEWLSALDEFSLFWDTSQGVPVVISPLTQVVTQESTPIHLEIKLGFTFNPNDIRFPEFRNSLPKFLSKKDALKELLVSRVADAAEQKARQWFVDKPLQFAITTGSINTFREYLGKELGGLKNLLGVNIGGVKCRPLIYENVEKAEIDMMASRADAQAKIAKLRALLDQVMVAGVPPKLLSGLMMADGGVENWNLSSFEQSDITDLPEARPDQVSKFVARNHGVDGLPQPQPVMPPPSLPASQPPAPQLGTTQQFEPTQPGFPPQFTVPNTPQPTVPHAPVNPPQRSRRGIDISKKVKQRQNGNVYQAKEGDDGVYRVEDDPKDKS